MPTNWRSPRKAVLKRRGFTLAEILLVLAVLVVIAAFAVPLAKGSLETYRLRKSADSIRSAFASARAAAARTGMTHIFQYTPESAEYKVHPWTNGDEVLEVSIAPTINTGGTQSASTPSMSNIKTTPLPEGITFHGVTTDSSARDARTITGSTSAMGSAPPGTTPILFYADGSSSNATVVLKNGRGAFIQIKLRGLTGHSTASNLLTSSQLAGS
jgi:prepilin-type N-terminal cleavage/methylation domain-containing protein